MKKFIHGAVAAGIISSLSLVTACTDDFEETNRNPNKIYDVELNDIFAGTVQRTANLWAEMNYNSFLNFSRMTVLLFRTKPVEDNNANYFKKFYVEILRDLVKLEREYGQNEELYANRLAVIKIWKSYCFYTMVSAWGPIPMSDAIVQGTELKRDFKYDSEEEVYTAIMKDLEEAARLIKEHQPGDGLKNDPIYGNGGQGDMAKWRKFANTLRLNIAMQVQNINRSLAETNAIAVLNDNDLISSNSENATMTWGADSENSASYYYTRFIKNNPNYSPSSIPAMNVYSFMYFKSFNDPRMKVWVKKSNEDAPANAKPWIYEDTITRPHRCEPVDDPIKGPFCSEYAGHHDGTVDRPLLDTCIVEYTVDYVPYHEQFFKPNHWSYDYIPNSTSRHTDMLYRSNSEYNWSVLNEVFYGERATWNILTYADACFLRAEANILIKADRAAARSAYEEGIRASMSQWGIDNYTDFMEHDGIKWGTSFEGYHDHRSVVLDNGERFYYTQAKIMGGENGDEGLLEQIYKQRQFADFFNGLEIWNLERRTRVFAWPPFFTDAASNVEGSRNDSNFWTERIIYPDEEVSKNATEYYKGVALLQASSPFARPERQGDNIFTTLAFAKKDKQVDNPFWTNVHENIIPEVEYYRHSYGATWDECVSNIMNLTGISNETDALNAMAFKVNSVYHKPVE